VPVRLVSIHKWSFLRCTVFSAAFRLRHTLSIRLPVPSCGDRKPLCGLVQHQLWRTEFFGKNPHFWIGHFRVPLFIRGWTLTIRKPFECTRLCAVHMFVCSFQFTGGAVFANFLSVFGSVNWIYFESASRRQRHNEVISINLYRFGWCPVMDCVFSSMFRNI